MPQFPEHFVYPTLLKGDRIILRPLTWADLNAWQPFFEQHESIQYLSLDFNLTVAEQAERWIERQLMRYHENQLGLMAIVLQSTGTLIGQAGLLVQHIHHKEELEIGYHLLPQYRKCGYATEAALVLKEFALQSLGIQDLICLVHAENIKSAQVAKRLGMIWAERINYRNLPVDLFRMRSTYESPL